jgi:hypothetical protein
MADDLLRKRFAERYQMQITSGRTTRKRIASLPFTRDFDIYNSTYDFQVNVKEVPCYDISIPEDVFDDLVETVEYFHSQTERHEMAMKAIRQSDLDRQVRENNPAVKQAWARYLMLLELARK